MLPPHLRSNLHPSSVRLIETERQTVTPNSYVAKFCLPYRSSFSKYSATKPVVYLATFRHEFEEVNDLHIFLIFLSKIFSSCSSHTPMRR
jgi:hypothetical protein